MRPKAQPKNAKKSKGTKQANKATQTKNYRWKPRRCDAHELADRNNAKQSQGKSKSKQRWKLFRCDAHELADLDIGLAKQSKPSQAQPMKT